MPPLSGFVRPPTAQEAVLGELRRAILRGDLKPGELVLQEQIGESLGVSRVPVREACHILEAEGLLTRNAKTGYHVTRPSESDIADLFRLRELLEELSVRRARQCGTGADMTVLTDLVAKIDIASDKADNEPFVEAVRNFYFAVFPGSDSSRLRRLLGQLWSASEPYSLSFFRDVAPRRKAVRGAKRVVRALRSGDVDTVLKVLSEQRSELEKVALAVARQARAETDKA